MTLGIQLSIIIITYKRLNPLKRCLENIFKSALPERYEVIVIINGQDEDTVIFFDSFINQNYNLKFYSIQRTNNGKARNEGIKYANGEILYFLDDDVTVREDIFKVIISKFKTYPDIDIIGGPNLTPEASSLFQKCSGYVFESIFGAANMIRRWVAMGEDMLTDDSSLILCNLAVRKKVFYNEKFIFNDDLISAEENLLLQQLKSKGYKILYSPELIVYHERRKNLREFAQQVFKYGKGRAQQTKFNPNSLPLLNILPSLFIIYLISLIFFYKFLYLWPLFIYLILDIFFSFQLSLKNKNIIYFPSLFLIFLVEHISYGLGFLSGLIMFPYLGKS